MINSNESSCNKLHPVILSLKFLIKLTELFQLILFYTCVKELFYYVKVTNIHLYCHSLQLNTFTKLYSLSWSNLLNFNKVRFHSNFADAATVIVAFSTSTVVYIVEMLGKSW